MKYKIKFLRGDVFASAFVYLPPANPVGLLFELNGVYYKIIDAVFTAKEKMELDTAELGTLTVTEIPAF